MSDTRGCISAACRHCQELSDSMLDLHKLVRELMIENEHLRQSLIRLREGEKTGTSITQLYKPTVA